MKIQKLVIDGILVVGVALGAWCCRGEPSQGEVAVVKVDWIFSKPAGVDFTKSEITVSQYRVCVNAGVCTAPKAGMSACNWDKSDRGNHPINCIDWNQAKSMCKYIGGRLPTFDELKVEASNHWLWEYPWGDEGQGGGCDYTVTCEGYANLGPLECGCKRNSTWPVCSKPKGNSISGLCDICGNVDEWTSTMYGMRNRVLSGGSWEGAQCRTWGYFYGESPTSQDVSNGVRCARSSRSDNQAERLMPQPRQAAVPPKPVPETNTVPQQPQAAVPLTPVPDLSNLSGVPVYATPDISDEDKAAATRLNEGGMGRYKEKDWSGAAEFFIDALEVNAGAITPRYNLACVFALSGEGDKAIALLQQLKDAGCDKCVQRVESAKKDKDFASVRDDPRFVAVVGE